MERVLGGRRGGREGVGREKGMRERGRDWDRVGGRERGLKKLKGQVTHSLSYIFAGIRHFKGDSRRLARALPTII